MSDNRGSAVGLMVVRRDRRPWRHFWQHCGQRAPRHAGALSLAGAAALRRLYTGGHCAGHVAGASGAARFPNAHPAATPPSPDPTLQNLSQGRSKTSRAPRRPSQRQSQPRPPSPVPTFPRFNVPTFQRPSGLALPARLLADRALHRAGGGAGHAVRAGWTRRRRIRSSCWRPVAALARARSPGTGSAMRWTLPDGPASSGGASTSARPASSAFWRRRCRRSVGQISNLPNKTEQVEALLSTSNSSPPSSSSTASSANCAPTRAWAPPTRGTKPADAGLEHTNWESEAASEAKATGHHPPRCGSLPPAASGPAQARAGRCSSRAACCPA